MLASSEWITLRARFRLIVCCCRSLTIWGMVRLHLDVYGADCGGCDP
jgi:hypothetical protein